MKLLKLSVSLCLMTSLLLTSGCLEKEAYLEPGQAAQIARPVAVSVWIKNKETGKRERRTYNAQAGDLIGRKK